MLNTYIIIVIATSYSYGTLVCVSTTVVFISFLILLGL